LDEHCELQESQILFILELKLPKTVAWGSMRHPSKQMRRKGTYRPVHTPKQEFLRFPSQLYQVG